MTDTTMVQLPRAEVLEAVRAIVEAFEAGDSTAVQAALQKLGAPTSDTLYQKLGTMTRSLHNSLTEFKQSLSRDNLTMSTTNIPDAADKLEAVIKMTLNAANTTLECTERNAQIFQQLQNFLDTMQGICTSPSWNTVESRVALLKCVEAIRQEVKNADQANSNILMAQTFQDLTGQAIRKVIALVTQLEQQLVELVQVFGHQIEHTEPAPSVQTDDPTATTLGKLEQDDADSVLKQFGF